MFIWMSKTQVYILLSACLSEVLYYILDIINTRKRASAGPYSL